MATQEPEMAAHTGPDNIFEENSKSKPFLQNTRRCCFCFPCFGSRGHSSPVGLVWWERVRSSSSRSSQSPTTRGDGGRHHHHHHHHPWWARGIGVLKKIREWSEIVAGPKWKTFIRQFNRNKGSGNDRHGKFQYDPLSYALNFDEGHGHNAFDEDYYDEDHGGFPGFSSRYASASGRPMAMDAHRHTDVSVEA